MTQSGILVQVNPDYLATALALPAVAGDTTVTIYSITDCGETGTAAINGEVHEFDAMDPAASTLHLVTPMIADAPIDTAVELMTAVGDFADAWTADVDLGTGEPPVEVSIPVDYLRYYQPGDEQAGVVVQVGDDGRGGLQVTSAPGAAAREAQVIIDGLLSRIEGFVELAGGTERPAVGPRVGTGWSDPAWSTPTSIDTTTGQFRGLWDDGTRWVFTISLFGGAIGFIDKTTGVVDYLPAFGAITGSFNPVGGIVKVGTSWYVLGSDGARGGAWYVYIFNASFQKTGEWKFVPAGVTPRAPMLTVNGTNLLIAYYTTTSTGIKRVIATTFAPAGDGAGNQSQVGSSFLCDDTSDRDLTGVYYGPADFGANRLVVMSRTGMRVFSIAANVGTRVPTSEWPKPIATEGRIGLVWDGDRFHELGDSGRVWHMGHVRTATSRAVQYAKYDNDPGGVGTQETQASDVTTWTQPARTPMQVITEAPADDNGVDSWNSNRIYIAGQLQPDLATGETITTYDVPATGGVTPPTSNGFRLTSAPGELASSAADLFGRINSILGSGTTRLGWFRTDQFGVGQGTVGLRGAGAQTLTTGTWTKVLLTGTQDHLTSGITVAASEVTVTEPGLYAISAQAEFLPNATGRRRIAVESYTGAAPTPGTGNRVTSGESIPAAGSPSRMTTATDVQLAAGATVRLIAIQSSTADLDIDNTLPAQLNVRRVG